MNTSYYIAKRYLFSKSSSNAINIITIISSVGVVLATMALFVVLSGFSGLKEFSKGFYQTSDPDIKITAAKGKTILFNDNLKNKLSKHNEVVIYSQVLEERAFFKYNDKEQIAILYGVDHHFTDVVRMDTTLIGGDWLNAENPYGIVVGNSISNKLSLGIDYQNPVEIFVPKPGTTYDITNPRSMVNTMNGMNIGVFALIEEIDVKYVFANLPVVQELLQYPLNKISGINIKLRPTTDAKSFAKKLQSELDNTYKVQTREQLNAVFYRMLNTENLVLYFIFTLVLIIALFNVIGTIIMMILDKKTNLKTLNDLGLTIKEIQKIFVIQGFLLGMIGLVVGLILGMILVFSQQYYALVMITSDLPYPVKLTLQNGLIVIITMTLLSYLSSRIAGSRISKKNFAEK